MDVFFAILILPAYYVARFLLRHDLGPKEPKKSIHRAVWFGVAAVVAASFLNTWVVTSFTGFSSIESLLLTQDTGDKLYGLYLVALTEEFLKFVPLAIYIFNRKYFNEVTDGVIYFSIVGLSFGVLETFSYSLIYGGIGNVLGRLVFGLFLHAGLTAMIGFTLSRYRLGIGSVYEVSLGFIAAVVLHLGYNFFITSSYVVIGMAISLLVSIGIFLLFYIATKEDVELGIIE